MEAIVAQAVKDMDVLRKTSVPWNLDEPYSQSYHQFDEKKQSWISHLSSSPSQDSSANFSPESEISNIALYTWNIDFMLPFAEIRMKSALSHLETLIKSEISKTTTAPVIFLQECTPGDLVTIASTPWVRQRFHLTDLDATNWATNHYGTVMLIDSRLPILSNFRVHYSQTRMDRDAHFVDVSLQSSPSPPSSSSAAVGTTKKVTNTIVRLCNTHLESLALEPPFRPHQMRVVARFMRGEGEGEGEGEKKKPHASLAAGDFNAIQPFDRTLHSDNDLRDAFLEVGGKEDTEEGFTWGQQAATKLREQFGCSRMDKVYLYSRSRDGDEDDEDGYVDMELVRVERFGGDVVIGGGEGDGKEEAEEIMKLGFEKAWVTDHLGLVVEVRVSPKQGTKKKSAAVL